MKLVLIACRQDRAKDWMRRSGLRDREVIIVTEARHLYGLRGIRKDSERGLFAIYVEDWWRRTEPDEALLLLTLSSRGFNGPFEGG